MHFCIFLNGVCVYEIRWHTRFLADIRMQAHMCSSACNIRVFVVCDEALSLSAHPLPLLPWLLAAGTKTERDVRWQVVCLWPQVKRVGLITPSSPGCEASLLHLLICSLSPWEPAEVLPSNSGSRHSAGATKWQSRSYTHTSIYNKHGTGCARILQIWLAVEVDEWDESSDGATCAYLSV